MIKVKRVYEPPAGDDGLRVLVDRLWPRGISKEKARADLWLKDIAPSDGLRKWFAHDLSKCREFEKRYSGELDQKPDLIMRIRQLAKGKDVTLLFGAKEQKCNNAVVLKKYLERR